MYFFVVDKDGNVVFNIYMLNFFYGVGMIVDGIGVLLNNELDDFFVKFGLVNVYGLIGGIVNVVEGGKWLFLFMSLMLVFCDGDLFFVIGFLGGSWIIIIMLQIILNVIDYQMNIVEVMVVFCVYY